MHGESPLNVTKISEKEWYGILVEDQVTMESINGGRWKHISWHAEIKSPTNDWEKSWRLARLKGLGLKNTSFLFKLLHCTLVTQERLARTKPNLNPLCKLSGCPGIKQETMAHALIYCQGNNETWAAVLNSLNPFASGLQAEEALRLEFIVEEHLELPPVFSLAITW